MARFATSFHLTLESALVAYSCLQGLGVFLGSFPLLWLPVILPLRVCPNQVSTFHYWSFPPVPSLASQGLLSVRFPSRWLICQLLWISGWSLPVVLPRSMTLAMLAVVSDLLLSNHSSYNLGHASISSVGSYIPRSSSWFYCLFHYSRWVLEMLLGFVSSVVPITRFLPLNNFVSLGHHPSKSYATTKSSPNHPPPRDNLPEDSPAASISFLYMDVSIKSRSS